MPDTNEKVDALDALAEKATPGPWDTPVPKRLNVNGIDGPVMSYLRGGPYAQEGMKVTLGSERIADHHFVAALVNAWRTWLRDAALRGIESEAGRELPVPVANSKQPASSEGADLISREQAVNVDEAVRLAHQIVYEEPWALDKDLNTVCRALLKLATSRALPAATQGWVMTLPFGESPLKQAAWDAFYATAESEIPKNPDGTHSGTFWVALMEGIKAYLSAAQPPAAPERE